MTCIGHNSEFDGNVPYLVPRAGEAAIVALLWVSNPCYAPVQRPCVDSTMYFSTFATSTGKKLSLTKSFGVVRVDKGKA